MSSYRTNKELFSLRNIKASFLITGFARFNSFCNVHVSNSNFNHIIASKPVLAFNPDIEGDCVFGSIEYAQDITTSQIIRITNTFFSEIHATDGKFVSGKNETNSAKYYTPKDGNSTYNGAAIQARGLSEIIMDSCYFYHIWTFGQGGVIYISFNPLGDQTPSVINSCSFTSIFWEHFTGQHNLWGMGGIFLLADFYQEGISSFENRIKGLNREVTMTNCAIASSIIDMVQTGSNGAFAFYQIRKTTVKNINCSDSNFVDSCVFLNNDPGSSEMNANNLALLKGDTFTRNFYYLNFFNVESYYGCICASFDFNVVERIQYANFINISGYYVLEDFSYPSCIGVPFFNLKSTYRIQDCTFSIKPFTIDQSYRFPVAIGYIFFFSLGIKNATELSTNLQVYGCQFNSSKSQTYKLVREKEEIALNDKNSVYDRRIKMISIFNTDIKKNRIYGCTQNFTASASFTPHSVNPESGSWNPKGTSGQNFAPGVFATICGFISLIYYVFLTYLRRGSNIHYYLIGQHDNEHNYAKATQLDNQRKEDGSISEDSYSSYSDESMSMSTKTQTKTKTKTMTMNLSTDASSLNSYLLPKRRKDESSGGYSYSYSEYSEKHHIMRHRRRHGKKRFSSSGGYSDSD